MQNENAAGSPKAAIPRPVADDIDGFYSGYFAGSSANGFAMFILRAGKIVGMDPLGVRFDGRYARKPDGTDYEGAVSVTVPPGGTTVQGVTSGPNGLSYEVRLTLPRGFGDSSFVRFETPLGPVNVRFVRLGSIDV
jgi:hypothetical protein